MDSIISWIGGKKALRNLIIENFPAYYDRYIEVFGGGGWVLFGKKKDKFEVYNDYNNDLVNLFFIVKTKPLAFIKELGFLPLNSRTEFELIKKFIMKEEFADDNYESELDLAKAEFNSNNFQELKEILTNDTSQTDVKRAANFLKLIRYSYGSGCTSFGCQPMDVRNTFITIWEAYYRLANTILENKDFEALIRQYDRPNTFFYCDPPYYETEFHYKIKFKKEDHIRLRDTLKTISGKFLLSYNDCDYIRELYEGYNVKNVSRINNMAQRYDAGNTYSELLITNFDISSSYQMKIFDMKEGESDENSY